jgi:hypothetical protein
MSSADIAPGNGADGRRERYRSGSVLLRCCHRLGAYLCTSDRVYRATLSRAQRRAGRCPQAFREWLFWAVLGTIGQGIAIGGGLWYFYAAEQEYRYIVEQRRQHEERQRELDRQSYFVRMPPIIAEHGEFQ